MPQVATVHVLGVHAKLIDSNVLGTRIDMRARPLDCVEGKSQISVFDREDNAIDGFPCRCFDGICDVGIGLLHADKYTNFGVLRGGFVGAWPLIAPRLL